MNRNGLILILTFILTIVTLGCGLFSSKTGDAEVLFPSTEVGTPEGNKVTKDIGPAGGILSSPDSRLTLTVPPNALTETIAFTIQPITNKATGGLGLAYRLEPSGKTFTTPLEISVRYDDHELEGTVAEAISMAYQDGKGAWRVQKKAKLDKEKKTLTFPTSHFTDWSFLARVKLSPSEATLYVGASQVVTLVLCEEPGFIDKLLSRPANCQTVSSKDTKWRVQGAGTIEDTGTGVIYTAPSKKPTPNHSWVIMSYEFEAYGPSESYKVKGEFGTKITIVDRGYRATGESHDEIYSGNVCDLEKDFTVKGTGLANFDFKFAPSSGTVSYTTAYNAGGLGVQEVSTGTYKIASDGADGFDILLDLAGTAHTSRGDFSGDAGIKIHLTPLTGNECGGQ